MLLMRIMKIMAWFYAHYVPVWLTFYENVLARVLQYIYIYLSKEIATVKSLCSKPRT